MSYSAEDVRSLDDLIGAWLVMLDSGKPVDAEQFVAAWPHYRTEFLRFVNQNAAFGRFAAQPVSHDRIVDRDDMLSALRTGFGGQYKVGPVLGRGGMGTVYAAIRLSDNQPVAIKLLNRSAAEDTQNQTRFRREVRAIGALNHSHVAPLLDAGQSDGTPYLVTPLIEGATLSQIVADLSDYSSQLASGGAAPMPLLNPPIADFASRMPEIQSPPSSDAIECLNTAQQSDGYFQTIARLAADVATALEAAHEKDIIHRDVKPSNLILDRGGHIWLTDFGLASLGEPHTLLTSTGAVLGTPAFMSPEQAAGNQNDVDHRTDVYALGATLYTLAALHRPYEGTAHRIVRDVCDGLLTPPTRHREDIPRELEAIILKAMSRDRSRRYQTCAAFETDLRRFAEGRPVQARLPGPITRCVQTMARYPRATFATAVCVLFAAASVVTIQTVVSQRLSDVNSQLQNSNNELESINSELTVANQRLIDSRDRMQHMVYVSDVSAAYRAYWNQDTDTARRILGRYHSQRGQPDQRGMEWHLLDRLSQPAEIVSQAAHIGPATEVAMIPGTREFLTSGGDGRVCRWRLRSYSDAKVLLEKVADFSIQGNINALAVSPDGDRFVVGLVGVLETNLANLYDLETGDLIRPLTSHDTTIESAAFSSDGTKVATASRYRNVLVHSLEGQLLHSLPADSRNVDVAFSVDGQNVYGIEELVDSKARKYPALQRWKLAMEDSSERLTTKFNALTFAISSYDGGILVAGYDDVALFNSSSVKPIATQSDVRGRVRVVAVSADGQHLAAGCDNGLLHLWTNVADRSKLDELATPLTVDCGNVGITSVKVADRDRLLDKQSSSGASSIPVVLVTCTNGSVKAVIPRGQDAFVRSPIKFSNLATGSSDSETLIGWSRGGTIYRFDQVVSQSTEPVELAKFQRDQDGDMTVSKDETLLALACPQVISIVSLKSGNLLQSLPKPDPNATAYKMAFSSDGTSLYVLFHDRLMLYSTSNWSLQKEWTGFDEAARRFAIHPQNGTVVITLPKSLLQLHPAGESFKSVYELTASSSGAVVVRYSAAGHLIAIGYVDGTIELLDAIAMRRLAILRGHRYDIHTLDFVNDDRTLISSSDDNSVRFWDIATGHQLGELNEVGTWCHVIPSHDTILTYTNGRPLKLWRGVPLHASSSP